MVGKFCLSWSLKVCAQLGDNDWLRTGPDNIVVWIFLLLPIFHLLSIFLMVKMKAYSSVCKLKCANVSPLVCLIIFHLADFVLRLSLNIEVSLNPKKNEAGFCPQGHILALCLQAFQKPPSSFLSASLCLSPTQRLSQFPSEVWMDISGLSLWHTHFSLQESWLLAVIASLMYLESPRTHLWVCQWRHFQRT